MIIKTDEQIHLQTLRNLIQSGKIKNIQSEWIGNVEMGLDGVSLLTSIIGGDVFVDPFDASFQCFVKVDMIGCSAGGASILVPMLTSAKARILLKEIIQIAKSPLWKIMVKEWRYAFKIIDKLGSNGKYFVEGVRQLNKLPDDVLERTLKTFDDYESAAKGFALLKVKNIEDIEVYKLGKLSKDNLVAGLKQLGDLQNRGVQVRKDVLVQMRSQNDVGHWAQITYAHSKLADPDVTLKVVGQKINVNGAEMDLDTVLQKKGTNKAIVDEVKNGQLTVNRDFEEQIDKLLSTKGQTIEIAPNVRVEIEKVRLAVSRKQVVPSAVNEYLTERKIEIVYFDGV